MGKKSRSGSRMKNLDHISQSLETIFGLKYLNSLMRIRDPGWKQFGYGMEKSLIPVPESGSGINIPDPQHCLQTQNVSEKNQKYLPNTLMCHHFQLILCKFILYTPFLTIFLKKKTSFGCLKCLNIFKNFETVQNRELGLEFWTKESKIQVLSEIRGSDPNFGHRGFF